MNPCSQDQISNHVEMCAGKSPQEILAYFIELLGDQLVLASSMSIEDQALTDMCITINPKMRIIFLDTGRLHQETYDILDRSMERYKITYEVYFPDAAKIEELVRSKGPNSFYSSVEQRKMCCFLRKVEPLKRALGTTQGWITGLRKAQAVTRGDIGEVEWDPTFNIVKLNPLAAWQEKDVWEYIKTNKVPYHKLYDKGFLSIGCAPCTRAIKPTDDIRSGRWWWENPEHKECGIHAHLAKKG